MTRLRIIHGDAQDPEVGTVEYVLRMARNQCNNDNTQFVLVIALNKPYPASLDARVLWSNSIDKLGLLGLLQWIGLRLHAALFPPT